MGQMVNDMADNKPKAETRQAVPPGKAAGGDVAPQAPTPAAPGEPPPFTDGQVPECPRCGQAHGQLLFRRLARPVGEYTHWVPCPRLAEPVFLTFPQQGGQTF
jgi:hypothetical protein